MLHEWNDKQLKVIMRQWEMLQMVGEDVMAHEARLADQKASLDAKEQEISLREEKHEATLRAKDESLEALVQQRTKELEDRHEATLYAFSVDFVAPLKKLTGDLDAASSAKAELDR